MLDFLFLIDKPKFCLFRAVVHVYLNALPSWCVFLKTQAFGFVFFFCSFFVGPPPALLARWYEDCRVPQGVLSIVSTRLFFLSSEHLENPRFPPPVSRSLTFSPSARHSFGPCLLSQALVRRRPPPFFFFLGPFAKICFGCFAYKTKILFLPALPSPSSIQGTPLASTRDFIRHASPPFPPNRLCGEQIGSYFFWGRNTFSTPGP